MTRRERIYKYSLASGKNALTRARKLAIMLSVLIMTIAVYLICFAGRSQSFIPAMTTQKAMVRVLSGLTFEYQSDIKTKAARDKAADRVPPSYDVIKFSDGAYQANLLKLIEMLNARQAPKPSISPDSDYEMLNFSHTPHGDDISTITNEEFLERIKRNTGFNINAADLPYILSDTNPDNRQKIFWLILTPLKEIINDGIYEDNDPIFTNVDAVYNTDGKTQKKRSQTEARQELKARIDSLGISDALAGAFYRIFNSDLRPNIVFNEGETKKKRELARAAVKPVMVMVTEGETIVEPAKKPSPLDIERLIAYKKEYEKNTSFTSHSSEIVRKLTISFLLMFSAALFIIVSKSSQTRKPKNVALFSLLLLLNLLLERLVIHIANVTPFQTDENWIYIFTFGTPVIFGPILQVLLCSAYTGFVMSLILSVLTTIMLGHQVDFFVVLFASSLVAIFYCNGAKIRRQVIVSGMLYGIVLAIFAMIMSSALYEFEASTIVKQGAVAIFTGFVTGVAATLVLPIFERIFNISSNITLLEFTDYNNPLLRMLQMEAPGTYHHSLMVAQIAEQAAVRIKANPLVCTVGGLYHDVGKVIKPEFFAENQAAKNPHDSQTPSMSALIIKSHIRDGVDLAKKYKMPNIVIDAIEQHHGNTVISYFYNKALNLAGAKANKEELLQALRDAGIEESTYRHEGTRPQTTETAILMLADSCEAASRSLKRVTPHSIEELVDKIFQIKMNDGQLDECPITLKQIAKVKKSFIFTLQNMLHSRVEYNTPPAAMSKPYKHEK